ncbi:glycosyltransferase family 8 protein [Megamonas hypermegale]|uniref:glycosyltransferase family 8 protein n=1 Tax=Megamonas hypermegale TaxID=158847 RepID=UPI00242CE2B5|nr:glycosyltransferase [Megamonas hypermegale]
MKNHDEFLEKKLIYQYSLEENNIVNIGYGIDNNFMRGTMTSIVSFCLNNKNRNFNFHIITYNLLNENKKRFEKIAKIYKVNIYIYIINIDKFKEFPVLENFNLPISMYFRFILPMLLKNIKNLLYIDGDIICLKKADNLFDLDLEEYVIAAVSDQNGINNDRNITLHLENHIYFNSGMLFIDVEKWNKLDFFSKARSLLIKGKSLFTLPDQDVLNIILDKKVKYIDCIFNCFVDYRNCNRFVNNDEIILLHFSAIPKPWNIGWKISKVCNSFNCDLYNYYENETPWKNTPLDKPRTYHEIAVYAKLLFDKRRYFEWLIWRFKWGIEKIRVLLNKK